MLNITLAPKVLLKKNKKKKRSFHSDPTLVIKTMATMVVIHAHSA